MQPWNLTILIVEDDADLAKIYSLGLAGDGHRVEIAGDGEVALEMLPKVSPDLVILDLQMPKLSGAQVLETMRSTGWGRYTPVVVFSNTSIIRGQERHLQALGVEDILVKTSFTPTELAVWVDRWSKSGRRAGRPGLA